jgi:virginiamycin B lyase
VPIRFTERGGNKIGRVGATAVVTEFLVPTPNSHPWGITAGPDGNVSFTEFLGRKIGRITPAGVITEFPLPTADGSPRAITVGPDGNCGSRNQSPARSGS